MEILNQVPIMEMDDAWRSLGIKLLIAATICAVGFLIALCCISDTGVIVTGVPTLLCLASSLLILLYAPEVETGRYKYEVIIDEQTPLVEIYKDYEIVEQRGDIWVIKDKDKSK